MKKLALSAKSVVFILIVLFSISFVQAANKTFTGPGNFSDPTKWSGGTLPLAGDVLRINGICTFDNSANNLQYGNLNVGFSATGTLDWPTGGTNTLRVAAISSTTAGSSIDMTNGGTLSLTGAWTIANQSFIAGTGTIQYNSGVAQTVLATISYNNLDIQGAGTKTAAAATGQTINIAGNLTVGANLNINTRDPLVNIVGNFIYTSGTITFSSIAASIFSVNGDFLWNNSSMAGFAVGGTTSTIQLNGTTASIISSISSSPLPFRRLIINKTGVAGSNTVSLGADISIAGSLTVSNGIFDIVSYNLTNLASLNMTGTTIQGSGTMTLGGNVTVNSSANTAAITAPVLLSATRTFTVANGAAEPDLIISSVVSGAFGITKAGAGNMILSNANTYTGATTISAGTLKLGAAGDGTNSPLGTTAAGTTIANGAVLDLNGFTLSTSESLALNGTGISNSGGLTNSAATAVSYNGAITLGRASSIIANSGDINITNTITGTFGLTIGGSGNGAVTGSINTATGTVTKIGAGTWTLSGLNSYTGTTTISAGILKIGAAGDGTNSPLGTSTGRTDVLTGAVLDLNGFTLTTSEPLRLNGTGVSNNGALTNSSKTPVNYSGAIARITAASIVADYGDIGLSGTISGNFLLTIGGSANINSSGVISGTAGLEKIGTGTLTLSANNTFTGGLTITSGYIQLGAANRIATQAVSFNGGTFSTGETIGFAETVGTLNLADNSNIALGTGVHSLIFAASNSVTWTSGKGLTIAGWTGAFNGTSGTAGKIFVGANAAGLTAAQLAQIQFFDGTDYYPAAILSTGEVVAKKVVNTITTGTVTGTPFCAGTTNIAVPFTYDIAGNFPVGTTTFSAQLSDASGSFATITEIGSAASDASGSQNIIATMPVNTPSGNGYRIRIVSNTPSVTGSDNGTDLIVDATNAWLGNTTDWNTASNWCSGVVPDGSTNVRIPDLANDPVISASTAADCNNIEIQSGATVTIQSDASNSGSLIVYGVSSGTGTVTYNRNMGDTRWYIASAPVRVTSGFNTLNSTKIHIDTNPDPDEYDFATYLETDNYGWEYQTAVPEALNAGQGYLISLNPSESNIQFAGTLNGDLTVPVVNSGVDNGWNALGNPFTSAIGITDLSSSAQNFLTKNAGILSTDYAAIYVWNEGESYNGTTDDYYKVIGNSNYTPPGGTLSDNSIQAGQGFMVNVKSGATSAQFTKAMQFHDTDLSLKSAEVSWPGITLLIEKNGLKRSTVVAFNENMTEGVDKTYDAGLLPGSEFALYTRLAGNYSPTDFAIQCLPDNQYNQLSIPVGINLPEGGEVTFKAAGVILPDGLYPVLEDKVQKVSTPLKKETDSYKVTLSGNTNGTGRFYLHVGGITMPEDPQEIVDSRYSARFDNDRITIFGNVAEPTKAVLYDIMGRKLGEYPLLQDNYNDIPATDLTQRIYVLRIEGENYRQVLKVPFMK